MNSYIKINQSSDFILYQHITYIKKSNIHVIQQDKIKKLISIFILNIVMLFYMNINNEILYINFEEIISYLSFLIMNSFPNRN